MKLNELRMEIFCHRNQNMEQLPPTEDALLQHCKRVIYQMSLWALSDESNPHIPPPSEYGWEKSGNEWKPVWITIPEVSENCRKLYLKCSCKGNCTHCNCGKHNLKCTRLCNCPCSV